MKKIIALTLLCMMLVSFLPISADASLDTRILKQPQNLVYGVGSVAGYSVTASGVDLKCTWYLVQDGKRYNLSNLDDGEVDPWESCVSIGANYVANENTEDFDEPHTTFSFYFNGIEEGLNGSYIYALVDNGGYTVESDKAYIQISEGAKSPPQITVIPFAEVVEGEKLEVTCSATAINGGKLSYIWYESHDADLRSITAIDRGSQTSPTLVCDTQKYGMRYYVCYVEEEAGGSGYSSVIEISILEKPTETEPKETEPKETEPKPTEQKPTEPKETEPKETEPAVTEPKETQPQQTEPDQTVAPTTAPQPTENTNQNQTENNEDSHLLYIIIALCVVLIGLLVTLIVLLIQKKKTA